ncbi:MAG: RagB/SusD family nutrient uptake outer membrane protein [Bacteroidaceae bacterium]|nr:RagB/SusD family nutrient uptake outer membrane protein [Bacteroidaceae bacterium]
MKKIFNIVLAGAVVLGGLSSCIEQIDPQTSTVTAEQASNAPGAYDNFVAGLTNSLVGEFVYSGSDQNPYDYGYPSFYLIRDVMGNDIAIDSDGDWYQSWYTCSRALGPQYAVCQLPLTYFFGWIKDCNSVIGMYKESPSDLKKHGVGIAYCMRALYYLDAVQMWGESTYAKNPDGLTVPKRTDENVSTTNIPRMTYKEAFTFILEDLDKAEEFLKDYDRKDVFTPNINVAYGLKARVYLLMEQWENAEKYAKLAQEGYTMMTNQEYTDRNHAFNTPNSSWIMGLTFKSTDPNITANDGDSGWGSHMIAEVQASGMGYAANYGRPKRIDAHLFSTIPATDIRKSCYIDPAVDELEGDELIDALSAYSDVPDQLVKTGASTDAGVLGCFQLKFRPKDGEHVDQYKAWTVAIPMMRVEEMKLIEIEAAGMQDEARGKQLLEQFAKVRDPQFVYGNHEKESYYNGATGGFRNEVWWQRRVELWGEGFATYDIKRLQKGIIRSYPGTNHVKDYRWNVQTMPQWMVLCFVQTESNYNKDLVQNPIPNHEVGDDPEYVW